MTLKLFLIFVFLHFTVSVGATALIQIQDPTKSDADAWREVGFSGVFGEPDPDDPNKGKIANAVLIGRDILSLRSINVFGFISAMITGIWDLFYFNGNAYDALFSGQPFATIRLLIRVVGMGIMLMFFLRIATTLTGAVVRRIGGIF